MTTVSAKRLNECESAKARLEDLRSDLLDEESQAWALTFSSSHSSKYVHWRSNLFTVSRSIVLSADIQGYESQKGLKLIVGSATRP
jgi:hypothetical protein